MISGNRDEAWPMYFAWPIPERFMLGVIWWHVTCMLSLAGHWQGRRTLSNHVCAHSVIPMWHVVCLQHLARASSEQSRSTTVLPVNHVIQIPQCLSGFVNHDYYTEVSISVKETLSMQQGFNWLSSGDEAVISNVQMSNTARISTLRVLK